MNFLMTANGKKKKRFQFDHMATDLNETDFKKYFKRFQQSCVIETVVSFAALSFFSYLFMYEWWTSAKKWF